MVVRVALGLIGVGGGILFLFGWQASDRAMHPAPGELPWGLTDYPDLAPETMTVNSRTGVALSGRFFRGRERATVILTHGYGANQDEMLPVVSALQSGGFSVFTYDSRGCGTSGGAVTLGALEQDDLRSVIDAVARRPDVDPGSIGALGFSMGAATTILEAADDPRIRAVVEDSGWGDVYHWVRPRLADTLISPRRPFSLLSLKLLEIRTGAQLGRLRPVEAVGRLSPRPILMIHGSADEAVPPSDGDLMFAAAGEPRELWKIQGAEHGDTLRPGGATSSSRVVTFFARALCPDPRCSLPPLANRE